MHVDARFDYIVKQQQGKHPGRNTDILRRHLCYSFGSQIIDIRFIKKLESL